MKLTCNIKTVTPIHIGKGEKELNALYDVYGERVTKYNFTDVVSQIPANLMLDERNLKSFNSNNSVAKRNLGMLFKRNCDFKKIKPEYTLNTTKKISESWNENNQDVDVQLKALNKPIIPGTTIKGAIFNAILYKFLKDNIDELRKVITVIENELSEGTTKPIFLNEVYLISKILHIPFSLANELIKFIQSNILCPDIAFESLGLYKSLRAGKKEIPLNNQECIERNQVVNAVDLVSVDINQMNKFHFDKEKKVYKLFSKKGIRMEVFNKFLIYMEREEMKQCLVEYFKDSFLMERTVKSLYSRYDPINEFVVNIANDNRVYLRLGNGTNYYFKSVSLIFKNYFPEFYKNYYEKFFSPIPKKRLQDLRNKGLMIMDIPKTRVLLYDGVDYYLPGILELIFDD